MGSVEFPGDAPRMRRRSLSAEQIRDPLGTLATAYGVERDLSHVAAAIVERLPDDDGNIGRGAQFTAVAGIVFFAAGDGRNLGRIYRGSPVAKPLRKALMGSVAFVVRPVPPEQFVEMVFREIRSALGSGDETS
ncbi:MAG TPA: hypothetical protein VIJ09_14965 [Acidimicrobiales bacterium]|jgi:hypothetical protein